MRRSLLIAAALALPLPALAQTVPSSCTVTRQCVGTDCTDNPGVTLNFQATAQGIETWDVSVPNTRISLTAIPGSGPTAWSGRAPNLSASVLITQTTDTQMVVTMHSARPEAPIFSATLGCGAPPAPPGGPAKG